MPLRCVVVGSGVLLVVRCSMFVACGTGSGGLTRAVYVGFRDGKVGYFLNYESVPAKRMLSATSLGTMRRDHVLLIVCSRGCDAAPRVGHRVRGTAGESVPILAIKRRGKRRLRGRARECVN